MAPDRRNERFAKSTFERLVEPTTSSIHLDYFSHLSATQIAIIVDLNARRHFEDWKIKITNYARLGVASATRQVARDIQRKSSTQQIKGGAKGGEGAIVPREEAFNVESHACLRSVSWCSAVNDTDAHSDAGVSREPANYAGIS